MQMSVKGLLCTNQEDVEEDKFGLVYAARELSVKPG